MLSTENPPPDPPCCSSEILLKTSSDNNSNVRCDENISGDDNQVIDLFNSGLDDKNPLPKFSIRDYVFSRRGKDIETHWPFSPKNLQLFLKHGVKDVLPPFQTHYSLRNPSTVKCAVESISDSHVKLSKLSDDHNLPISLNDIGQNLASNDEHIRLSGSEEDKKYPSTTKNKSRCDFNIKSRYLTKKVESNTQNPVKKCKLIVKLNNVVETKTKEASLNASETMASKVCPVCKTFSSSSNTTLNAHIDQCLSGESTAKCTTDSKAVKHRIKPRKTKSMVDIYETALHCTLEDLDRRNGTNWASNLSFPPRDSAEEKDKTFTSEDKNEETAVYVDSNGTKLRILSKFSDPLANSSAKDDCGSKKLVERDKESKFVSIKKKKHLVHKHNLPNHIHGQRNCSPKSDRHPEVNNGEQTNGPPGKGYEKDLKHAPKDCGRIKTDDFGMIKSWVGSKSTGLKKKINPEHESQHRGKVIKNLKLKGCLSSKGEKFITRTRDLTFSVPSDENPILSIESHRRKENLSCNAHGEFMDQPRLRKRPGISLSESRGFHGKKNRMVREHHTHPSKGTENHALSQSSKKKRITHESTINADRSLISSKRREFTPLGKTSSDPAVLSERKKFSSPRKNLFSESRKNLGRKHLNFKKRKLYYMSESDDEATQMENPSHKSLINTHRVLKIQNKDGFFVDTAKEGDMAYKGSEKSPKSNNHDVEINVDSFKGTSNIQDAEKEVEIHEKIVFEPTTNIADGEAFAAFSESLHSQFAVLGHEQETFCGAKVGEDLIVSNANFVPDIDANEGQGNYFIDVDPIPIPGPPGSFLPSPGRMSSEELQGNSSLTTCRIHSSEDEHELVDMDSKDSPVSTTSVVSDSQTQHFSKDRTNRVAENLHHFEGQHKVDDGPRAKSVISETCPPRVENSQPCCCSLNYQDSQLLRRRTMNALSSTVQIEDDQRKNLYGINLTSQTLPQKEQSREPEKITANSSKGYCESSSPSTPNPILRLMGKNLMVVNTEENLPSPQIRPTQSSMVNEYRDLPRGPPAFDNNTQACIPGQRFGFGGNCTLPFEFFENEKSRVHHHRPVNEIIVIDDDLPENETGKSRDGISRRVVVDPMYGYSTRYYPVSSGSHPRSSFYFSHGFP